MLKLAISKEVLECVLHKYLATAKNFDFDSAKYVGSILWGVHPGNILEKEWLEDYEVEFEGMKMNAFKGYDNYLKNRYGENYMELPPIEQRVTHSFIARRVKNEKDKNFCGRNHRRSVPQRLHCGRHGSSF